MPDFDHRQSLDRYIYDYLIKRNLHGPAEIFRNEANLEIDPDQPPAIDEPEGFLLEWWRVNCDFDSLRRWLNQNANPSLEATQEHDDSQSGQFVPPSERNKQLQADIASAMGTGSKSPASDGWGKGPQVFSPSSQQEKPQTTILAKCTSTNHGNTSGQKPEPSVYAIPRRANIRSIEETDPSLEFLVSIFWLFEDEKAIPKMLALGERARIPNVLKIDDSISQAVMSDDNTSKTSDSTCNSTVSGTSKVAERT